MNWTEKLPVETGTGYQAAWVSLLAPSVTVRRVLLLESAGWLLVFETSDQAAPLLPWKLVMG